MAAIRSMLTGRPPSRPAGGEDQAAMKPFSIDYYILVTVSGLRGAPACGNARRPARTSCSSPRRVLPRCWEPPFPSRRRCGSSSARTGSSATTRGGLSSNEIAFTFFVGVLTAWVLTVVISSAVNHRSQGKQAEPDAGLGSLAAATYFRALASNLRFRWREWRR